MKFLWRVDCAGFGEVALVVVERWSRVSYAERPHAALTRELELFRAPWSHARKGASTPPLAALMFDQLMSLLRAIGTGRIGPRFTVMALPAAQDRVDPVPGGFHLVAAHE